MANPCYATQHSDQMICHKCGLVWDMSDQDPPECRRRRELAAKRTPKNQPTVVKPTKTGATKHV